MPPVARAAGTARGTTVISVTVPGALRPRIPSPAAASVARGVTTAPVARAAGTTSPVACAAGTAATVITVRSTSLSSNDALSATSCNGSSVSLPVPSATLPPATAASAAPYSAFSPLPDRASNALRPCSPTCFPARFPAFSPARFPARTSNVTRA